MKKIAKLLAPTDLSDLSSIGVRYALDMARELSAEVLVYHVVALGEDWFSRHDDTGQVRDLLTREKAALDAFLREKCADYTNLVEISQKVEIGAPHTNIPEMAEREGIDMIVMSTHGRTGLDHMLLGSVTEKVVQRAPCPVLAIPAVDRKKAAAKAA